MERDTKWFVGISIGLAGLIVSIAALVVDRLDRLEDQTNERFRAVEASLKAVETELGRTERAATLALAIAVSNAPNPELVARLAGDDSADLLEYLEKEVVSAAGATDAVFDQTVVGRVLDFFD